MFRKKAAEHIQKANPKFRMRSREIFRIEAFSDAVFAFAVTLLIVSLEVPETFNELLNVMHGFFAFAISFLFLMLIWHEQNTFFRRYGLNDLKTTWLNGTLIFVVLFYMYPLKFLFTMLTSNWSQAEANHEPAFSNNMQVTQLMIIYGIGMVSVYFLFFLMYVYAYSKRKELELNEIEIFHTKSKMFSQLILLSVGVLSLLVAALSPPNRAGLSGLVYILIGPALFIFYSFRGRISRKKFSEKINS